MIWHTFHIFSALSATNFPRPNSDRIDTEFPANHVHSLFPILFFLICFFIFKSSRHRFAGVDIEFFRRLGFSQNNTCPPVRGAPPITAGMSRRLLFPSESLFTEVHERKALFTSIWKINLSSISSPVNEIYVTIMVS